MAVWRWAQHCIYRVLKGWAGRVRSELQSQEQENVEESRLGGLAGSADVQQ